MKRLYAWAHAVPSAEAAQLADRLPGLGLVLTSTNLDAAERVAEPPIAYVTSVVTAARVADMARAGVPFRCAIVLDERNEDGPSGPRLDPEAYAAAFRPVYDLLRPHVRVSTMGLMAVGGWWRSTVNDRRFDGAYHAKLPAADLRAWNPNRVRLRHVHEVLRAEAGPWVLSPAPFRGWWERLWEPVSVAQWAELSARDDVAAVALWCLREVNGGPWFGNRQQVEHGLFTPAGDLTVVGRAVERALRRRA